MVLSRVLYSESVILIIYSFRLTRDVRRFTGARKLRGGDRSLG